MERRALPAHRLPAIVCFHWVSAGLAAALAILALARLARWLTPGQWLWTVAGTLCVLVAVGDEHRWYGNFAFVRMWQGKGIFLFVFLPLIHAYAIELALRPSRAGWLRLFAAQVAALGCTSSALWAGPASALVAAAAMLRPDRRALAVLGMVLLSSAYVVGAGVAMRQVLADTDTGWVTQLAPEVEREARERKVLARDAPGADLEIAFSLVLGRSHVRTAALVGLLAAWALCPPGLARRYAVVVPLGVGFVLLDPYMSRLVSANVTGPSYWRALWILPVPLLLGLVLTAPLRVGRLPGPVRRAGAVLACAAFAWAVPATGGLSRDNGVEFAWPRLKVPEETYRWAALLTARAGPGAVVVAPGEVGAWRSLGRTGVDATEARFLAGASLLGIGLLPQAYYRVDAHHLLQALPPFLLVAPVVARRVIREAPGLPRAARHAAGAIGGALVLAALTAGVGLRSFGGSDLSPLASNGFARLSALARGLDPADPAPLAAAIRGLAAAATPDERILVVPMLPQVYYFARRPMSGVLNMYAPHILEGARWRKRNLQNILAHPPGAVLVGAAFLNPRSQKAQTFRRSHPELNRYLRSTYREVASAHGPWRILHRMARAADTEGSPRRGAHWKKSY